MKCAGYRAPGELGFCFTRSHWLDIYNLANHNKVPPAKLLLGKPNLDFSIQIVARKIAVKNLKIFTLKTRNSDGNRPSNFCGCLSYISVVVACL